MYTCIIDPNLYILYLIVIPSTVAQFIDQYLNIISTYGPNHTYLISDLF